MRLGDQAHDYGHFSAGAELEHGIVLRRDLERPRAVAIVAVGVGGLRETV